MIYLHHNEIFAEMLDDTTSEYLVYRSSVNFHNVSQKYIDLIFDGCEFETETHVFEYGDIYHSIFIQGYDYWIKLDPDNNYILVKFDDDVDYLPKLYKYIPGNSHGRLWLIKTLFETLHDLENVWVAFTPNEPVEPVLEACKSMYPDYFN